MCAKRKVNLKNLPNYLWLILSIILLKIICVQQNKHDSDGISVQFFRFQNFEPRSLIQNISYENTSMINKRMIRKFQYGFDENNSKRESRGFHFETSDEDITVEIEYIIPFGNIPIEKSTKLMKNSMRQLFNLQTGALLWTAAFLTVGAIVASVINALSALKPTIYSTSFYANKKQARDLDYMKLDGNNWNNYIEAKPTDIANILDEKLHQHNINLKTCMQFAICQYIGKIAKNVDSGRATSRQRIFDGLLRAHLFHIVLNGTAVHHAIEAGQNFKCELLRRQCTLTKFGKNDIEKFLRTFFKDD